MKGADGKEDLLVFTQLRSEPISVAGVGGGSWRNQFSVTCCVVWYRDWCDLHPSQQHSQPSSIFNLGHHSAGCLATAGHHPNNNIGVNMRGVDMSVSIRSARHTKCFKGQTKACNIYRKPPRALHCRRMGLSLLLLLILLHAECLHSWSAAVHIRASRNGSSAFRATKKPTESDAAEVLSEIQKQLVHQQKQIEQLLSQVLRQQSAVSAPPESTLHKENLESPRSMQLTPVKAMIFIDGTWLFYSIYQRETDECPICLKFGSLWALTHNVDWQALLRVISRRLMEQYSHSQSPSQSSILSTPRPVEVVRASVFTSYKADTSTATQRYKMFEELRQANFDVHMMETVGKSEKCVDIQLAVEMLHFATVPHAYDVAVLLTGDKDFMPAMIRTRQKGRKVALVSMKLGCNMALVKTDMLKDFNVIWLDDHIEEFIVPKPAEELPIGKRSLSPYTILKILQDFVAYNDKDFVFSRDVGRFFKKVRVGSTSVLNEVKKAYGGLYMFLAMHGSQIFIVDFNGEEEDGYSIRIKDNANQHMLNLAKSANLTRAEIDFLESYSIKDLREKPMHAIASGQRENTKLAGIEAKGLEYTSYTLSQLKDVCREMGLPVSGLKAAVLDRIQAALQKQRDCSDPLPKSYRKQSSMQSQSSVNDKSIPQSTSRHLLGLLTEYISASGGKANSRAVGRYLAANRSSTGSVKSRQGSALHELKSFYGSLASFVQVHSDVLYRLDSSSDDNDFSFSIGLRPKEAAS